MKQLKYRSVNHAESVTLNKVNVASHSKINEQEIDLTHTTKRVISQPTLLVGSSLFKGIKIVILNRIQLLDHFLEQGQIL